MIAIELEGVSKKYRKHGDRPLATTLMSYVLHDMWTRRDGRKEFVWALQDVTLRIEKGKTIGIIGRNGSGKSTLLRIINRILKPNAGTVAVRGDIAALISLGAGFHPELTGRENTLINGVILGLTKTEIKAKFEEIVEFSELGDYMDEPVRTYSTGMCMRLGFSVAVHVNPEILLLDEVLAVGDAAFSRKCIERMNHFKQVRKTIVLVTHNLEMVRSWCDEAVWLHDGMVKLQGDPNSVVEAYSKEF